MGRLYIEILGSRGSEEGVMRQAFDDHFPAKPKGSNKGVARAETSGDNADVWNEEGWNTGIR
jgi:hypothetical protein